MTFIDAANNVQCIVYCIDTVFDESLNDVCIGNPANVFAQK